MSWKSIRLSIYSIILFVGLFFGILFLFKLNVVLGIIGIVLWIVIPGRLRTKALNESSGVADKVLAKYIVPLLGAVIALLLILTIALWIEW